MTHICQKTWQTASVSNSVLYNLLLLPLLGMFWDCLLPFSSLSAYLSNYSALFLTTVSRMAYCPRGVFPFLICHALKISEFEQIGLSPGKETEGWVETEFPPYLWNNASVSLWPISIQSNHVKTLLTAGQLHFIYLFIFQMLQMKELTGYGNVKSYPSNVGL